MYFNVFFRSRFPPYKDENLKLLRQLTARRRNLSILKYLPYILMFGLGVLTTVGFKAIMKVKK